MMYQKTMMDFNSIKVRLKLYNSRKKGTLSQFQFHKGTIKTSCENRTVIKEHISIP